MEWKCRESREINDLMKICGLMIVRADTKMAAIAKKAPCPSSDPLGEAEAEAEGASASEAKE